MSAFQIGKYLDDVIAAKGTSAAIPTGKYTVEILHAYHWRDIISFGNCFLILMLSLHMMIIVGFFDNIIHYRKIQGNDHDRVKQMRLSMGIKLQKPMIKGEIIKEKPGGRPERSVDDKNGRSDGNKEKEK